MGFLESSSWKILVYKFSLVFLALLIFFSVSIAQDTKGSRSPNFSEEFLIKAQLKANLTLLNQDLFKLEKEIINTTLGWWYPANKNKIKEFGKRYRNQLEEINCYRRGRVAVYPDCLNEIMGLKQPPNTSTKIKTMRWLSNSGALEIAISNSKRIRERLMNLKQANLTKTAILLSSISLVVTFLGLAAPFIIHKEEIKRKDRKRIYHPLNRELEEVRSWTNELSPKAPPREEWERINEKFSYRIPPNLYNDLSRFYNVEIINYRNTIISALDKIGERIRKEIKIDNPSKQEDLINSVSRLVLKNSDTGGYYGSTASIINLKKDYKELKKKSELEKESSRFVETIYEETKELDIVKKAKEKMKELIEEEGKLKEKVVQEEYSISKKILTKIEDILSRFKEERKTI